MNEFVIEWVKGAAEAVVTAPTGTALCNKLKRYAETHPEELTQVIVNRDGSICCHVPVSWVKVRPPRKLSAEAVQAATERMKAMRAARK